MVHPALLDVERLECLCLRANLVVKHVHPRSLHGVLLVEAEVRPSEIPVKESDLNSGNSLVAQETHDYLVVVEVVVVGGVEGRPTSAEVSVEQRTDVIVSVGADGDGGHLGGVGADFAGERLDLLADRLGPTEESVGFLRGRSADLELGQRGPAVKKNRGGEGGGGSGPGEGEKRGEGHKRRA